VFDWKDTATKVLKQTLDEVQASDPAFAAVKIRSFVVQGNAAGALLDASEGADLLVVGNRGHGGFARAVLGSVSQHCTQQATCPVVVVRPPKTD
jgi:nucleotide-binding universal stress UspA family protein